MCPIDELLSIGAIESKMCDVPPNRPTGLFGIHSPRPEHAVPFAADLAVIGQRHQNPGMAKVL